MENQEEKLQLSEYLQICVDIEAGKLDPEAGDKALQEFFNKLVIKDYMKHKDKIILLGTILYRLNSLHDETSVAGFLEMNRIMYGLLGYCINLNNDLDTFGSLFGIYDAIREFGLYDYIIKYCKEDFELFSVMLRDSLNVTHIKELSNTMIAFNETDFEKWVGTLKEFKEQITPEVLKNLVEFGANNNSAAQELLHSLSEAAIEDSEAEMKKVLNIKQPESTPEIEQEKTEDITKTEA